MKNKAILIIVFALLVGCNGEKKNNNTTIRNKENGMKKFDIEEFIQKTQGQGDNKQCEFSKNDSVFKLMETPESFYEESQKNNEKFRSVASYDKQDLHIVSSTQYFYKIPIGKTKFYNEEGQVVSEKNNDEHYPFSVNALINKVKLSHGIDLNTSSKVRGVKRKFDGTFGKYVYIVNYQNGDEPIKYIVVDAQDGEILQEGIVTVVM